MSLQLLFVDPTLCTQDDPLQPPLQEQTAEATAEEMAAWVVIL